MRAHNEPLRTPGTLQPAREVGRLHGFSNLLRKEHAVWWATRRWLVHALLWPLLLNSVVIALAFDQALLPERTALEINQMVTTLFFLLAGQGAAFGAVAATQSALVGEKQRGTAAWVLSKPIARPAFVLAKLAAQLVGFVSLAVLLPSAIFYGQSVLLWGSFPPLLLFAGSVLVLALHVVFYLALTLMLGTFFRGSGSVAGLAVGGLLVGLLAQEHVGKLSAILPWKLPALAALFTQQPLPRTTLVPVAATACWAALFIAVAVWRFGREEF
jgi:ABC-2 type transport system permease protein